MKLTATLLLLAGMSQLSAEEITRDSLGQRLQAVDKQLQALADDTPQRVDVEICVKAVDWILRHDEFYKPDFLKQSSIVLDIAEQRIASLQASKPDWGNKTGRSVVAYRSRVDDSVQPYAVTLPEGFNPKANKRWPMYVVLHGRNGRLNEVSFFGMHEDKSPEANQNWIQVDVFGRVNNAYRWAGETDVFEAISDAKRRYRIDDKRITLWGFSMGGAGAWHLGLHHPSTWVSAGAGAGFVDFYKYQNHERLPDYQHRALTIYDTVNYADNLNVVPFITYGGEKDKQLASSLIMNDLAKRHQVPLSMIVGPNMGHKFDDVSRRKFMEFLGEHNQKGRSRLPGLREFEFATHTLKYNRCEWFTIQEMAVPYSRTTVKSTMDAAGNVVLKTNNVTAFSVVRDFSNRLTIDDSEQFNLIGAADDNLPEIYFVKTANSWLMLDYNASLDFVDNVDVNKRHDLQGPIDDAFMEPFLCVAGTSQPQSERLNQYANWSLKRFQAEFDKWMRADAPTQKDHQVNPEKVQKHLILFGDPGSNSVIKAIQSGLPVTWDSKSFTIKGNTYSTDDHALVMIYPNPLNPRRYVVINSGMTTHEKDFKASNSWLFPKLGDYAVIHFKANESGGFTEEVVEAGLFDSHWQFE